MRVLDPGLETSLSRGALHDARGFDVPALAVVTEASFHTADINREGGNVDVPAQGRRAQAVRCLQGTPAMVRAPQGQTREVDRIVSRPGEGIQE